MISSPRAYCWWNVVPGPRSWAHILLPHNFHLNHFYFKIFIFVLLFILISYYYVILITIHNIFFCLEQWNVCILQHFKDSILRNNYTRRTLNGLITRRIGQHDQYESEINKKAKIKTISNFKGQSCTLVIFFFLF